MKSLKPLLLATLLACSWLLSQSAPVDSLDAGIKITVPTMAALRLRHPIQFPHVYLTAYSATSNKGGGDFEYTGSPSCTDNSGTLIQAVGGCYARKTHGQPFLPTWFGAVCGGQQVTDGVSTNTTSTLTSATAAWTSAMVGWKVVANKAAASSNQVDSTITAVGGLGTLTMSATSGASNTSESISVYPDDTTALNATFDAATAAGVPVALPAGDTCGYANPGSYLTHGIGTSLYLNGGRLWLGQTGPVQSTGYSIEFVSDFNALVGPGIIDGLYQINQGIFQSTADAVLWQHGAGISYNGSISHGVVIQNTKGRALDVTRGNDFHISDLSTIDCGDFSYVPPSGDPEQGRSMCVQFEDPRGPLSIKGLTAEVVAQSGLLISDSSDANFHASISDCYFYNAAYFGLDFENNLGSIDVTNCRMVNNGIAHSRSFLMGGSIVLNTGIVHMDGVTFTGIGSNAVSWQSLGAPSNLQQWTLSHSQCLNATTHDCSLYFQFQDAGIPTRVSLDDVTYDSLQVAPTSSPTCPGSVAGIMQQLFTFNNIFASHQYGSAQTNWTPTASNNTSLMYVLGRDSDLGTVNIAAGANNPKSILFDQANVLQTGATTFVGGATAAQTNQALGTSNPTISRACP